MPYLKSAPATFSDDITLYELSGLQRLLYLEYIAAEEANLTASSDTPNVAAISAMNIRLSARLVALSLLKSRAPETDNLDDAAINEETSRLQREILREWSWDGIAASAFQVRELSGMIARQSEQQADQEPITAEKP